MAWHVVAQSSDLEEGTVRGVKVREFNIALYRIEGTVYATSNICTHGLALLSDESWMAIALNAHCTKDCFTCLRVRYDRHP